MRHIDHTSSGTNKLDDALKFRSASNFAELFSPPAGRNRFVFALVDVLTFNITVACKARKTNAFGNTCYDHTSCIFGTVGAFVTVLFRLVSDAGIRTDGIDTRLIDITIMQGDICTFVYIYAVFR